MLQFLDIVVKSFHFFIFLNVVLPDLLVVDEAFCDFEHLRQDFFPGLKDRKALIFGGDHIFIPSFSDEFGVGSGLTDTFGSAHAVQVLLAVSAVHL